METQAERLLGELRKGRRLTKRQIRGELGIENVGGRIADLRDQGVPVATIWIDRRTRGVIRDEAGKPRVWFGDSTHWGKWWTAVTREPGNTAIAAYQLFCCGCRAIEPERLGWQPMTLFPGQFEVGDFAEMYLCPSCRA
jgi:hypothetical protein